MPMEGVFYPALGSNDPSLDEEEDHPQYLQEQCEGEEKRGNEATEVLDAGPLLVCDPIPARLGGWVRENVAKRLREPSFR